MSTKGWAYSKESKKMGPEFCQMQETDVLLEGCRFRRLDIGLDGIVEGYLTKEGQYHEYLTNALSITWIGCR